MARTEDFYVTSRLLLPVTFGLQRLGLNVRAIAAEVGFRPFDLISPTDRIDYRTAFRLAEVAYQRYGDTLALDLAALYEPGMFGAVDFLGQTSQTLGEAMSYVRAYEQTIQNVTRMVYRTDDERVVLTQRYDCPEPPPPPVSEGVIAFLVNIARKLTGEALTLHSVAFSHSRPANPQPYLEFFGIEPTWNAPDDGLVFESAALDLRMLRADAAIAGLLEDHVRGLASIFEDGSALTRRVQNSINELLPSGRASAVAVAEALNLSVRSLQRRLAVEGTSFARVARDVRCRIAMRMLKDVSIPLEAIVERAGFQNRSAFNRAFKQWTGDTPANYRKKSN